jgi:FPC/CPF motif-containing protein YcgG
MEQSVDPEFDLDQRSDDGASRPPQGYFRYDGARLVGCDDGLPPAAAVRVHDAFRALALDRTFPCIGAKLTLKGNAYGFGLYDQLGCPASSSLVARDLGRFMRDTDPAAPFRSFVASFANPQVMDESRFEAMLWSTLQQMNRDDRAPWAADAAIDPSEPTFSFSFGATAFFVVGLHAGSSRLARRFAWPTLVFNPQEQFERLKREGRYQRFQQVIRQSERSLQGDINPMLADFGEKSAARQFSGRRVDEDWVCPFQAHQRSLVPIEGVE